MAPDCNPEPTDPRIRRTRQLLQQALGQLLATKEFDKISIQEIADAATVNRVTFYDHYPDKFALLDGMVSARFHHLLTQRGITFNGTCASALSGMVHAIIDFLTLTPGVACRAPQHQMEPHLESAIIGVVRGDVRRGQGMAAHSGPLFWRRDCPDRRPTSRSTHAPTAHARTSLISFRDDSR
jgi:AcrR family transcriptional regulator